MDPVASLSDLVDALQMNSDEHHIYFDRQSGQIVRVEETILSAVEEDDDEGLEERLPAWQKPEVEMARAIVADSSDRFISPPDKFEFNEYRQMERFIASIAGSRTADQLWLAIKGGGPFRVFKDTLRRLGLEARWYRYLNEAMKRFVIEWAESNDVAYEDDFKPTYK